MFYLIDFFKRKIPCLEKFTITIFMKQQYAENIICYVNKDERMRLPMKA